MKLCLWSVIWMCSGQYLWTGAVSGWITSHGEYHMAVTELTPVILMYNIIYYSCSPCYFYRAEKTTSSVTNCNSGNEQQFNSLATAHAGEHRLWFRSLHRLSTVYRHIYHLSDFVRLLTGLLKVLCFLHSIKHQPNHPSDQICKQHCDAVSYTLVDSLTQLISLMQDIL